MTVLVAGDFVWQSDDEATAAHVDRHRQAGNLIAVVDRSRFAQLEPQLRGAPGLAAWCPQEFAIDVTRATHVLLRAAKDAGAELVLGETIEDVVSIGGRIESVTTASRQHGTDAVVYAGGSAETELSRRLNVHRRLTPSPAAVLRFPASERVLRRIICGPAIEARQDRNLVLHVPEYLTVNFDADELDNVCATTRATLLELFGDVLIGPGTALAADRPMPIDKMWARGSVTTSERHS